MSASGGRAGARAAARLLACACVLAGAACGDGLQESPRADGSVASYAPVQEILARSCAYARCHAPPLAGAGLDLSPGSDYRSALVDVPACEYEQMDRVEPGAPERSWLMVKLTAEYRDLNDPYATYIYFSPDPGWDPDRRGCPDETEDGTPLFGQRMPLTAPFELPEDELAAIRSWIAAGAPP